MLAVVLGNERVIYYDMSNWLQKSGTLFIRSLTKGVKISKTKLTFEFVASEYRTKKI